MKEIFSYKKILIIAAVILLLLSACSGGNDKETANDNGSDTGGEESTAQEVTIRMSDDPDFLDPHSAAASMTFMMILNMFEGLLATETDGSIKPAIAEEYEVSEDSLTYTFKLREGVKFHNGEDVTVEDIQYSFERLLGVHTDEPLSSEFDSIDELEARDENTFVITLKEPNSNFLYTLTALNAAIIPESNDDQQNENPIGTGPFQFVEYSPGTKFVMEKNDDYWQDGIPYLDKVNFAFQTDDDSALLAMQAGEIDIMDIPAHRIPEMEDNFTIDAQEVNSALVVTFNNEEEPFDDVRVRQAINYAINKDDIIESVFSGYAAKLGSNMSPAMGDFYLDGLEDFYSHDVEKAKELLVEAGYPDGFSTTITISSHRSMYSDIAQVVAENLKEAGIEVEIETVEWGIWLEQIFGDKNYEMTTIDITGRPSAYEILNDYLSTNNNENFHNFNNEDFDQVMADALLEDDLEEQIKLYHQAQEILTEEAAAVFVADYQFIWTLNPDLEGTKYYPFYFHDMSEVQLTE